MAFFIPAAKFPQTHTSASDAQFMADSEEQLAEKALGEPISVAAGCTKPSYAIVTIQDHVVSPDRVVEVLKTKPVAKEKDGSIISNKVPIPLLGIKLESKPANVALRVSRASSAVAT
jgi:hypothetical protein